VNARSCKHLKSLLGEAYEAARMKLKNPHGPPQKSSKSASKTKTTSKRKKAVADEDEGVDERPGKKVKKPAASTSNAKGKSKVKSEDEDEVEDDADEVDEKPAKKKIPELLLAVKWDIVDGHDPTGWWISEKLDGVRYGGTQLAFGILIVGLLSPEPISTARG